MGQTIPQLTAAGAISDSDLLPIYQGAAPMKRTTVGALVGNKADVDGANVTGADATAFAAAIGALTANDVPPLLLAGTLTNQGNGPYWIKVLDGTLYVLLTNDFTVKSYDLTDPSVPVLLGSVTVGSGGAGPAYIAGYGNYLYVTDQNTNTLRVIDATNPSAMSVVGTVVYEGSGGGGGRCDVSPDGTKLCIGGTESGANANKAIVVDVSTPASPTVLGRTAAIGSTHRGTAWVSNTVFAVASRDDKTIMMVDASTPSAPVQVGSYVTPNGLGSVSTPVLWDSTSSTLYYGNFGTGAVLALDVSTPSAPTLKDSLLISPNSEQLALTGTGRLLIACRNNNTLVLVDCSTPTALTEVDTFVLPGTTTPGVGFFDGYAYVTAAGDTANGKIFTLAVEPTLEEALLTLQAATASVAANSATLTSNTFSGTQTVTAATALSLTNASAVINIAGDLISRTASAAFSWLVTLRLTALLIYTAGTALRFRVDAASAQDTFTVDGAGEMRWGPGTGSTDCRAGRRAIGVWGTISTHISTSTAGFGFRVAEGSNAKQGTATLVAGTVTVSNTSVTANSRIFLTAQDNNTTGALRVSARTASTSFDITSSNAGDSGLVAYEIFEPA